MTTPAGPSPLDAALDRLYAARFSEAERRTRVQLWRTLCDRFFARYVSPSATVLDLGGATATSSPAPRRRAEPPHLAVPRRDGVEGAPPADVAARAAAPTPQSVRR